MTESNKIVNTETKKKISYVTGKEIIEYSEFMPGDKVQLIRINHLMNDKIKSRHKQVGIVKKSRLNDVYVFFDHFDSTKRVTDWISGKYLTKLDK